jgi:hypothetical protein
MCTEKPDKTRHVVVWVMLNRQMKRFALSKMVMSRIFRAGHRGA